MAGASRFEADQVVFDLADLDPSRKDVARAGVIEALRSNDYGEALVGVRINPIDSMWAYRDVVDVVEQVGEFVDGVVVPRVSSPGDVEFVDTLVGMVEQRIDLAHRIDIEAEIATAQALALLDEIALASDRLEALVLDEAGALEALGATVTTDGSNPTTALADALAHYGMRVLVAARAVGADAVIAPCTDDEDHDAFAGVVQTVRALGYNGVCAVRARGRCPSPTPRCTEQLIGNDATVDAGSRR